MEKRRGIYTGEFSIDPVYLFFLVNTMQIGIGILRAPRVMAEDVGNEGWISVLLGAVLVQLVLVLIFRVLDKYENREFLEVGQVLLGKPLNYIFSVCIGMYYFLLGVFLLRDFIGVLQDFIFQTTPVIFLILLFLYPCYLILRGGISLLTRFSVVVFLSTVWLALFLIYPFMNFQWEFMLPLFHHDIKEYVQGIKDIALDYFGFEIVFFFYPLIRNRKKALLYASLGHWFSTLMYLAIVIAATGLYGSKLLKYQSYPMLDMFRLVQLPFIERIEIIGVSTWSFTILLSVAGFIMIAGKSIDHIHKNAFLSKPYMLTVLMFVALLFMPDRFMNVDRILLYIGTSWLYVTLGSTVIFTVLSYFKSDKRSGGV